MRGDPIYLSTWNTTSYSTCLEGGLAYLGIVCKSGTGSQKGFSLKWSPRCNVLFWIPAKYPILILRRRCCTWKLSLSPLENVTPLWFCQTASATPRQGAYGGRLLGAPGGIPGKPLYKITCPDLMETILRWKSGLLLGGKAQPLKSTRQITAKSFCACRKCRAGKECKDVLLILLWSKSWQKAMREFRGLIHNEVY